MHILQLRTHLIARPGLFFLRIRSFPSFFPHFSVYAITIPIYQSFFTSPYPVSSCALSLFLSVCLSLSFFLTLSSSFSLSLSLVSLYLFIYPSIYLYFTPLSLLIYISNSLNLSISYLFSLSTFNQKSYLYINIL